MPFIRTKLHRPPGAADHLHRQHLLDRLNQRLQRPLTLISAPAGYGKTTLASCWLEACESPSGWLSLHEQDNDLRLFLTYVVAAVQTIFPHALSETMALLNAANLPPLSVLVASLTNELDLIEQDFILVLDDIHHIQDRSVYDLLTELLRHPPQAMHLVLLTRRDPAFPLARLRGLGRMTEIRASDLRFTSAETADFLSKMLEVPVKDATAALLEKKTEGWVTGLRLAGLYLRDQVDLKQRVQEISGSSQHIAEYLVEEVLAKQNPNIEAFLVETTVLDRFCAPLCQALHSKGIEKRNEEQDVDAQRFIDWLVEANIFIVPLDDEGYWFRYHHLFREFLKAQLHKRANPDTIARLHMLASKWFADNGLIDEAIRQALAAGESQEAVRLVVEHRYDLLNTSKFLDFARWLRLLPEKAIVENPILLMSRAFLGFSLGPDSDVGTYTKQASRRADALPAESPESSTLTGEIASMQSMQDVMLGQPASASIHAQKALQLLPRQALFSRSLAIGSIAGIHQMEGDCGQGIKVLKDSLTDPVWPAGIRMRMWVYHCAASFMEADSSGVLWAGRKCLRTKGSAEFIHPRSNAQFYLGAIHYLRNELVEARHFLTDVVTKRAASQAAIVIQASGILGFIHLAEGCPEEAGRIIEFVSLDSWHMHYGYAPATRNALLVEFTLRQGKVDEARRLGESVEFDLRPPHWLLYTPQLTPIKLLLAEGTDQSLKEAHTRLAELDEHMHRVNRKSVRIDVLALLALVCNAQGEETSALENLQAALDLSEPGGWIRNFVDLGAPMLDLLERLNQAQPGHTYTQQALDACRAQARINALAASNGKKTSRLSGRPPGEILTDREIEILPLLAEGLSNKQIAARLFIAPVTVKTHLQNIYRKLNAEGRIQALKKARELGLLTSD